MDDLELSRFWGRQMRCYLAAIGDDHDRDLAEKFEVAVSTVGRWRRGTAIPHWRVARQIAAYARYLSTMQWESLATVGDSK